jgi:hypothetical protein
MQLERARGGQIDGFQRRRDDILLGHLVLAQTQYADVARRWSGWARTHFHAELKIADDLGGIIVHTPGAKQRLQVR